jgi:O-antigen/teichoic acid export membrane protein
VADELASSEVKARAVKGVTSLLVRQLAVRALGFAGMLVLARILTPEIFGIFAIGQFVVFFFDQIGSLGLAAALIRKKDPVTELELRTVFTVQQIAVFCSVGIVLFSAPAIVAHYGLDSSYVWLIRVMAIGLVFASLRTIPTILLERNLRHDAIAGADVAEYLAYQVTAIALALMGFGIWALALALLVRGVVGVAILYRVSWWRPRIGFDMESFKSIVSFGLPIQLGSFTGLANNAVVPIVVGSILGVSAVGFVNFAKSLLDAAIFQPLILMGRVQLPLFARVQDRPESLGRALERSSLGGAALVCLCATLLISQAEPLIQYLATSKWLPALPLLYVLGPVYLLHVVLQPLTQAFKAIGDAVTPLHIGLIVFVLQLGCFVFLSQSLGLMAYAVSLAVALGCATIYACVRARKRIPLRPLRLTLAPIAASIVACGIAISINRHLAAPAGVALSMATALAVYATALWMLCGKRLAIELGDVVRIAGANSRIARLLIDRTTQLSLPK